MSTGPSPATVTTVKPRRRSIRLQVSATIDTPSVRPSRNEVTAAFDRTVPITTTIAARRRPGDAGTPITVAEQLWEIWRRLVGYAG